MPTLGLFLRVALLILSTVALAAPSGAATIFYETFDAEVGTGHGSGGSGIDYTGFASWTVSSGTVDLIAHDDFAPASGEIACYGGSGKCVDLDGTNDGGVLTSVSLLLQPGTYELSYHLSGVASSFSQSGSNASNTVNASITGGLFFESVVRAKGDPYGVFGGQFTVLSATSVQIVFEDLGADSFGAMLDEVRLAQVPEPGTAWLVAGGLLGLGLRRRRDVG